jgi:glycosyltransferase involved in cell wall biosynthesis
VQVSESTVGDVAVLNQKPHSISVVIPVYNGGSTLPALLAEINSFTTAVISPNGNPFWVSEVLLVWDGGSPESAAALRELEAKYSWVRPIWLSRNFGQHAATLAGMSSTSGEWVVTLDEDGQHDPAYIGQLLDCALAERVQLVYAAPSNGRPHGFLRNVGSASARWMFNRLIGESDIDQFHSYRLMLGEVARGTAAYTGPGVYLDVALSWVVATSSSSPVPMRSEGREASNYSFKKLLAHFGRLVISSGTRPLIIVSVIGFVFFMLGIVFSLWVLFQRFFTDSVPQGWTSSFVATLVVGGLILLSLGVIAQYLRTAVNMSLGKPLYVVVDDPTRHFPQNPSARN